MRVAGGTRHGAGAARTDTQRSNLIEPGDRPSASSDLDNVDHRNLDWIAGPLRVLLDPVLGGDLDLVALDERRLGGSAADIEGDQVVLADLLADRKRSHDTAHWT